MSKSWWDKKLGTTPNPPAPRNSGPQQPVAAPQAADESVSVFERAAMHGQGMAAKTQHRTCPNCGSGNLFSLTHQNGPIEGGYGATITTDHGQVQAGSRCFDCNWNSAGYDLSAW